jgi:hypothetical protein
MIAEGLPEAAITTQSRQQKSKVRKYYWIIIDSEPGFCYEKHWENREFGDKSLPAVIDRASQEISYLTGKPRYKKTRLKLKRFFNRKDEVREAVIYKDDGDL